MPARELKVGNRLLSDLIPGHITIMLRNVTGRLATSKCFVFLQFEHTKEWHSFHVYMTTSVSAYDIIQITLNDYSSRY